MYNPILAHPPNVRSMICSKTQRNTGTWESLRVPGRPKIPATGACVAPEVVIHSDWPRWMLSILMDTNISLAGHWECSGWTINVMRDWIVTRSRLQLPIRIGPIIILTNPQVSPRLACSRFLMFWERPAIVSSKSETRKKKSQGYI